MLITVTNEDDAIFQIYLNSAHNHLSQLTTRKHVENKSLKPMPVSHNFYYNFGYCVKFLFRYALDNVYYALTTVALVNNFSCDLALV